MYLLLIDTSSKKLQVAISKNDKVVSKMISSEELNHSRDIIVFIEKVLKKARLKLADMDSIVIVIGPGSFTGLRIGVVLVKGLSYVTGKKVVSVTSLDSIALNIKNTDKDIVPIIDAKKGMVYSAVYRYKRSELARISKYMLLSIDELLKKLKRPAIFVGDGVGIYKDEIESKFIGSNFAEPEFFYPELGNIAKLGFKKIKEREFEDIFKLEPLYIYHKFCSVRGFEKKSKP